ncbi:PIN domain-containing protein [Deferrisoma palaeochoriense]
MSAERVSLDTNILVYAVDRDAGERHERAAELVDQAVEWDCVLPLQALCEFFSAATRKGKMPVEDAEAQVRDWMILFPVVPSDPSDLSRAMAAVARHSLSFWDALLWATVRRAGVRILYTENFQGGRELGGVQFVNPFAAPERV